MTAGSVNNGTDQSNIENSDMEEESLDEYDVAIGALEEHFGRKVGLFSSRPPSGCGGQEALRCTCDRQARPGAAVGAVNGRLSAARPFQRRGRRARVLSITRVLPRPVTVGNLPSAIQPPFVARSEEEKLMRAQKYN
ncbi:hypothetical protein NDU88_000293 [Pleurodeles waltl]|uniref:Uncharacterized protein n=1 Tax=Pleurodeles waltl TaxID=8319 RepID=A0AAV7MH10_PLEWA|nr:hypothetical protein NDU88_000293 [Pleurodeles waltl]